MFEFKVLGSISFSLMKCPHGTHKQTKSKRHAALAATSGTGLSGINPSLFSVIGFAAPQI